MYCLIRTGAMLSVDTCNMLMHSAREMYGKGKRELKIKNDECEGEITTKGEGACLGSISGILFEATLDHDQGSTRIRFIVHTRDLPEGAEWWITDSFGNSTKLEEAWN